MSNDRFFLPRHNLVNRTGFKNGIDWLLNLTSLQRLMQPQRAIRHKQKQQFFDHHFVLATPYELATNNPPAIIKTVPPTKRRMSTF
jgi:hypothetical protein